LRWVRALTVSMHLGFIDGPFVPQNLISAQESPVLLRKFQMAHRLKILMSCGSKKGNYPFLSKSPDRQIPFRFPNGAPMERERPTYRAFLHLSWYIPLTYLSGPPVKEPSEGGVMQVESSVCNRSVYFVLSDIKYFQDQAGAMSPEEVAGALDISSIPASKHKARVLGTQAPPNAPTMHPSIKEVEQALLALSADNKVNH